MWRVHLCTGRGRDSLPLTSVFWILMILELFTYNCDNRFIWKSVGEKIAQENKSLLQIHKYTVIFKNGISRVYVFKRYQ